MSRSLPPTVSAIIGAADAAAKDLAWSVFLRDHSDLILRVARLLGGGEFTTWLVLVVRQLCLDDIRRRYGRLEWGVRHERSRVLSAIRDHGDRGAVSISDVSVNTMGHPVSR